MDSLNGYVATGVVSLLVGLLLRSLEPRVQVVWWRSHDFFFHLTKLTPPVALLTQAITIQNVGRKSAEGIEIIHKVAPDFFKLNPALPFEEDATPSGEHIVRVASLGPREFFTIEFLAYAAAPELLHVRSKDGPAKLIPIKFNRVYPPWFNRLALVLLVVGLGTLVYWLIRITVFILRGANLIP